MTKHIHMKIEPVENIKNELLKGGFPKRNFPKAISFEFDSLYREIVTQIKTIELSSECVLFDSVYAVNENKEYADESYWSENMSRNNIPYYWFFAQNGQGDLWLFDKGNKVYFYNHDLELFDTENFTDLNINFSQWLQYAYLQKAFDKQIMNDKITDKFRSDYKNRLSELSELLLENYPFEI